MSDPLVRPVLVSAAEAAGAAAGFTASCLPETGSLLAALAAAKPGGRIAESGAGYGVGSAWLATGMHGPATLLTVERDAIRVAAVRDLFAGDPRVTVLAGDWTLLREHQPYDVFFCDGGGKRDDPDGVIDLLAPGGILVLDDFVPHDGPWPPMCAGEPDLLRIHYLRSDRLVSTEVRVRADAAVLVCVRR